MTLATRIGERVRNFTKHWARRWQEFWFGPIDLLPASVFRLCFGIGIFVFYAWRLRDFSFLFSDAGILPYAMSRDIFPDFVTSSIPWGLLATPSLALPLYLFFLLCLFALAVGWLPRLGVVLTFCLHLVFVNRNPIAVYGADQIASCLLFYLCFIRSSAYLRLGKRTRESDPLTSDLLSTVGCRLIQVQLCIIYVYSGLAKAQGKSWWQGDALWNVLANGQLTSIDFSFLQNFPTVLTVMTYLVVLWETYFPCLVWLRATRTPSLLLGVFLHTLIGITMGIPFFSLFMISTYLLWIEPSTLKKWFGHSDLHSPRPAPDSAL